MAGKKIGIVLAIDGEKEFIQAVQNAKKEANLFKTELKNVSEEFKDNANSMEALRAKQEVLTKQQDAYQRKLVAAKAGLNNAKKAYNQQTDALEELKKKLEGAQAAQKKMEDAGDNSSDAYKKQCKQVEELSKAVDEQAVNAMKASGKVTDWNKRVAESEGDLRKCNKALDQNAQYMKEAENSADHCATSIDGMGKQVKQAQTDLKNLSESAEGVADSLKESSDGVSVFGDVLGANLATKGIEIGLNLLKDGAEAVKESMYDISGASAKLAASTGLSESAAKKYQKVMQQIKGDNFGEDYNDVADAMSEVIQIMGELNDTEMTNVTESALTLRDTFNMEVNGSIRAADVMMKTMGVDAQTAFDMITTGAQNGLNRSGELVDNITEYGQLWGQAGFSAEQMFAIMENGLDAGAYNLDKVNDYVKEFGNSMADGRIEKNLSSFSSETQTLFNQCKNGYASTSDVFYSVINDLSEMTNQQEALTLDRKSTRLNSSHRL